MSVYTERAAELFGKGFNCSQAVFAAFCDKFGMDEKTALKVASGLGGGVGRMREVCGAMCGAAMVAGMVYGDDTGENREAKSYTYKKVQEIAAEFKKTNPSIICRELLGLSKNCAVIRASRSGPATTSATLRRRTGKLSPVIRTKTASRA